MHRMTESPAVGGPAPMPRPGPTVRAGRAPRALGVALAAALTALVALGLTAGAASAQTAPASPTEIAARIVTTGRYLDRSPTGDLTAAIDSANRRGVAFVWLNTAEVAGTTAEAVSQALAGTTAPYVTVLVLTQRGLGAKSSNHSDSQVNAAINASFDSFRSGATADGVSQFVDALGAATTSGNGSSSGASGGGSGSLLLPVAAVAGVAVVGGGGLLALRSARRRRQDRQRAAAELERDRTEIRTQLQDNADRVLTLGDRVIASGDAELQTAYEQATSAYQEVSRSIDGARTAQEVDALDDRIDQAEWQFEMIEARLDGKPVPPSPAERKAQEEAAQAKAQAEAQARANQPALRPDQSVFGPQGSGPGPTVDPGYSPFPGPGGRGGMGGLGGVLGTILMGGGGLPGGYGGGYSRRSQRRYGGGFPGGGGGFPDGGGGGSGNRDFPQGGGSGNRDF